MSFFYKSALFEKYIKEAKKQIEAWHKSSTPYMIYGAGIHSKMLSCRINLSKTLFLGFIDQSKEKQKRGFLDFPVYSPEHALKIKTKNILISSYEYQEAIKRDLLVLDNHINVISLYKKKINEREDKYTPLKEEWGKSAKKKRIAVVDTFFCWPPIGGSSVDLSRVMNAAVSKGYEVTFFLPLFSDKLYFPRGRVTDKSNLKFKIYNIPVSSDEFTPSVFAEKIGKEIDQFEPDYIFLGDMYAFKPFLAKKLKKYQTIWRSYNYDIICPRMNLINRENKICGNSFLLNPEQCKVCLEDPAINWEHPIFREISRAKIFSKGYYKLLNTCLQQAKRIIIYNDIISKRLPEILRSNNNFEIKPSGVDKSYFVKGRRYKEKKRVNIFLPGRIEDPVKGFDFFVTLFKVLIKKFPHIRLMTTGKYETGIKGVVSLGWICQEKMGDIYKKADICVIPSLWEEPFGIVALEAMASGIPVVASRVGGLKDIVGHNKTGFLLTPNNSKKFSESLEKLISDPALRRRMGKEGVKRARLFLWEDVINQYKNIFPLISK